MATVQVQAGVAAALGVVFALGLGLAGMTDQAKVMGFLDITGQWDPSLAFVMGGAVLLGLASFAPILRRKLPVLSNYFDLPTATAIDGRLLVGAVLFGIGWGLAGWCPGPALTSLATGRQEVAVFVLCMFIGIAGHDRFLRK
jgi:uncharacterized membrane protein YedE/YeeE